VNPRELSNEEALGIISRETTALDRILGYPRLAEVNGEAPGYRRTAIIGAKSSLISAIPRSGRPGEVHRLQAVLDSAELACEAGQRRFSGTVPRNLLRTR
jgi:hypothetical protein